jgi:hypothetical protein
MVFSPPNEGDAADRPGGLLQEEKVAWSDAVIGRDRMNREPGFYGLVSMEDERQKWFSEDGEVDSDSRCEM